jgi:hypothetical protein
MKFLFLHGSAQSGAEDLHHFPVMEVFASELQLGSRHVALLKQQRSEQTATFSQVLRTFLT